MKFIFITTTLLVACAVLVHSFPLGNLGHRVPVVEEALDKRDVDDLKADIEQQSLGSRDLNEPKAKKRLASRASLPNVYPITENIFKKRDQVKAERPKPPKMEARASLPNVYPITENIFKKRGHAKAEKVEKVEETETLQKREAEKPYAHYALEVDLETDSDCVFAPYLAACQS